MAPIGRIVVFLLPVMMMAAGCGGGGSDEGQGARGAGTDQQQMAQTERPGGGRAAIPPKGPDAVEGLKIAPYLDEAGTQTEGVVAVGELFPIYICVDHPGYDMAASQWRMIFPEGITVVGEIKVIDHALTIGSYQDTFAITYPCQTGGKTLSIYKYTCIATEDFKGGTVETVKAVSVGEQNKNPPFIGFVTCAAMPDQVPAYGGSATLRVK